MDAAPVAGSGEFYDVEKASNGNVRLYNLPDGKRALRLDPFEVEQNTELYVWLSEADEPRTSAEAVAAPHTEIALLKSTLGSQNYVLPDALSISRIGSVVIWCAPVRIAYSAARLTPT
ncbi:MAG TPA: DM13 domain-containing protein [Acidimicrobiales bacterium]|nr:DM13 domain-containing protein [Acidimicrobiales bacterium]